MEINNNIVSSTTTPTPKPAGSGSGGDPVATASTDDVVTLSTEALKLSEAAETFGSGSGGDPG